MARRRLGVLLLACGAIAIGSMAALADANVTVLHTFAPLAPYGCYPYSTLVEGADGNFYGTAVAGGPADAGTIFQVTTEGVLTPIYSFTNGLDGGYPRASLLLASDGNFYGTAEDGGSNGMGTVFRVTTNGVFTALYSFQTNGIDGEHPQAALIEGANGNFYGTTVYGGTNGGGTIYEITPSGAVSILHSFSGVGRDGAEPMAPLVLGTDGNFYGTTSYGGIEYWGTVFRMTPQGAWTNLHSFTSTSTDGALPWAGLVEGTDGNFYGTTYSGGPDGYGTVFMVTPGAVYTNLYSFTDGWDGGAPNAALVQGPNGNFYGTSQGSTTLIIETNSIGTVFEITPSGSLTTLYSFTDGCDGANPTAGLVLGTDGSFYGAADAGGTIGWGEPTEEFGRILGGNLGWGTIFNITPDGFLTPLCEFTGGSEGANPGAGLIQAANGLLYGVTERGGTNDDGTVFQMGLDGTVTTLYSFTGGADGAVPLAALTPGSDGNFYGTTYGGGSGGVGAVFMITPAGLLTPLHTFANGADGSHPMASLVQGTNGSLYGTTVFGGAGNGAGTVFEITPGGGFATLYTFKNGSDGGCPEGLALGPDGQFYGVADGGGVEGNGTVFRITTAGVFTNLYSFKDGADGAGPSGALTLGRDGNFYGVCSAGGSNQYSQYGTVFKITTAGSLTPLYSFTGTNDGVYPQGPLTLGADGNFYGTTASGANGYGTVFQITTNGALTTLHWFTWLENGLEGYSAVAQATNGNFYIACEGMSETSGTVLRMVVPPVLLPVETTGKAALLKWAGQPGQKYQVQYSGSLAPANWTNLGPPMVAAGCLSQCTNAPPSASQGFYRVAVLP